VPTRRVALGLGLGLDLGSEASFFGPMRLMRYFVAAVFILFHELSSCYDIRLRCSHLMQMMSLCLFSPNDEISVDSVNYCYTQVSCWGNKIPMLTSELLMTKADCCYMVAGASWGGVDNKCEACAPQTADSTYLPLQASSKYTAQSF